MYNILIPAAVNAGKLVSYWDLPWFSYSSADPDLADKITYNTLIRMISPYNRLADAMGVLFNNKKVCSQNFIGYCLA